ncbi:MAG TPA: hypothetical protein V6D26_04260, partial [Stenomitos sp.]
MNSQIILNNKQAQRKSHQVILMFVKKVFIKFSSIKAQPFNQLRNSIINRKLSVNLQRQTQQRQNPLLQ